MKSTYKSPVQTAWELGKPCPPPEPPRTMVPDKEKAKQKKEKADKEKARR